MTNETPPTKIDQLEFDLRVLEAVVAAMLAEIPRERLRGLLPHFDLARHPLGGIQTHDADQHDAVNRVLNRAHEFVEVVLNADLGEFR